MKADAFKAKAGAAGQLLACGQIVPFHSTQIRLKAGADDKGIGVASQVSDLRMPKAFQMGNGKVKAFFTVDADVIDRWILLNIFIM